MSDELCMVYMPIAGRGELVRLIAAAGGLTLNESAELPAGESKSQYVSPSGSGTPLLKHGDLKLSQSGAIEAYLASIAPKFSGLTPQQRAIDGMYAGIKEEMLSNCAKALFTTKNGEDVTKLLDDRWFPLMEASIPAEGFINGLAFPTVADLAVRSAGSSRKDLVEVGRSSRRVLGWAQGGCGAGRTIGGSTFRRAGSQGCRSELPGRGSVAKKVRG